MAWARQTGSVATAMGSSGVCCVVLPKRKQVLMEEQSAGSEAVCDWGVGHLNLVLSRTEMVAGPPHLDG